jgi:hypothetical protein
MLHMAVTWVNFWAYQTGGKKMRNVESREVGLTKREYAAVHLMQGLMSEHGVSWAKRATWAAEATDALFDVLEAEE